MSSEKKPRSRPQRARVQPAPPQVATIIGVYIESEINPRTKHARPSLAHLTFVYQSHEYEEAQEVAHVAMPFPLFIDTLDFLASYLKVLIPDWKANPKKVDSIAKKLDPLFVEGARALIAQWRAEVEDEQEEPPGQ